MREDHGYIVCEGAVLSPKGRRVIVSKHHFAVSANVMLVPLLVETAAADLDVRILRGKVVLLVASILQLVKSLMRCLVVPLALRHDLEQLLDSEDQLLSLLWLLLLEVMAEQEHRNEAEPEDDDLFDQRMGDTAYEDSLENASKVVLGEEQDFLSQRLFEHLS